MEVTTERPAVDDRAYPASELAPQQLDDSADRVDSFWLAFLGIVPVAGLLPMLCVELVRLWGLPHYRFFPLTLIGFTSLVALNFRPGLPDYQRLRVGAISVAIGCLFGLAAILFFWPTVAHVASAFLLFGWLAGQLGETRLSRIAALIFLYATAIPLLGGWDLTLLRGLQSTAASWASGALDAMGILHLQTEGGIAFRTALIPVSRIGGGPDSVFFLFSLAALLIAARRHGLWSSLICLAFVPLWFVVYGVLCNVILALYADAAEAAGSELPFTIVRLACLAVVCIAMIAWDLAIVAMLRPKGQVATEDEWLVDEESLVDSVAIADSSRIAISRYGAAPLAATLLLAGCGAALLIAIHLPRAFGSPGRSASRAAEVAAANPLPQQWRGWQQVGFASNLISDRGTIVPVYEWRYTRGVESAIFSLVGGNAGGDAVAALEQAGWRAVDMDAPKEPEAGEALPRPIRLQNAAGGQAFLLTAEISPDGRVIPPTASRREESTWQTIFTKLSRAERSTDSPGLSVRLLYTSIADRAVVAPQVQELFAVLAQNIAAGLAEPSPNGS